MTCLPYYVGIPQPINIAFFLINITCSLVSINGNSLTIFVVATRKHLQVPMNLLLAALSVTDLFAGMVAQPIFGTYLSFFHASNNCVLEKTIVFMSATSCATSLLLLCVIARDRYLHVAKGLRYNQHTNRYQVLFLVVGCWTIGFMVASTFILSGDVLEYLGFATFSGVQLFSFTYILIMYLRIQRIVARHFKRSRAASTEGDQSSTQTASELRRERVHNMTLLILLLLFIIVWFPFMIILIIGTVYQTRRLRPESWLQTGFVWTAILTYVNGAINPLIYSIRYKEIGSEMKNQARKLLRCSTTNNAVVDCTGLSNQSQNS